MQLSSVALTKPPAFRNWLHSAPTSAGVTLGRLRRPRRRTDRALPPTPFVVVVRSVDGSEDPPPQAPSAPSEATTSRRQNLDDRVPVRSISTPLDRRKGVTLRGGHQPLTNSAPCVRRPSPAGVMPVGARWSSCRPRRAAVGHGGPRGNRAAGVDRARRAPAGRRTGSARASRTRTTSRRSSSPPRRGTRTPGRGRAPARARATRGHRPVASTTSRDPGGIF